MLQYLTSGTDSKNTNNHNSKHVFLQNFGKIGKFSI